MPELPEVEVVRRGLLPHAVGARIQAVRLHDPRSARRQDGGAAALVAGLQDARISALVRRGKFLWWRLQDSATGAEHPAALMTHLGMSGQLRVRERAEAPAPRHLRVELDLDTPDSGAVTVDFIDQRLFGGLWLSPLVPVTDGHPAGEGSSDLLLPRDATHIARDVLDPATDLAAVARRLRQRRAPIKSLLLAQDVVSGIGSIYADEALWAARAHPAAPGSSLSQVRAHRILIACREVMLRALGVGGTSFDALYVNVDGRSGDFAQSLSAYGRAGKPCRRCGRDMVGEVVGARSSVLCPRCQRKRSID